MGWLLLMVIGRKTAEAGKRNKLVDHENYRIYSTKMAFCVWQ